MNLILGNSEEELQKLESNTVDLTVTSPPYDDLRSYKGHVSKWNEETWKSIIKSLFRVTKEGGVVVWNVSDATINGSESGTSFRQALWAMECGFNLHDTMIWQKSSFLPLGSKKCYLQCYEYMFVFSKGIPKTINFIEDRENISFVEGGRKKVPQNINKDGVAESHRFIEDKKFGKRFNIWKMNVQQNSEHPAPFPEQLSRDHIITWSNEGDVVLDPFMGSGTTGVSCKKLNRKFIGIEIEKEFFEMSKKRIEEANPLMEYFE
jgi:DNA modification methylase